jgi:hypothetical protein
VASEFAARTRGSARRTAGPTRGRTWSNARSVARTMGSDRRTLGRKQGSDQRTLRLSNCPSNGLSSPSRGLLGQFLVGNVPRRTRSPCSDLRHVTPLKRERFAFVEWQLDQLQRATYVPQNAAPPHAYVSLATCFARELRVSRVYYVRLGRLVRLLPRSTHVTSVTAFSCTIAIHVESDSSTERSACVAAKNLRTRINLYVTSRS